MCTMHHDVTPGTHSPAMPMALASAAAPAQHAAKATKVCLKGLLPNYNHNWDHNWLHLKNNNDVVIYLVGTNYAVFFHGKCESNVNQT